MLDALFRRRFRPVHILWGICLAAGCSPELPTQIVVVMASDLRVPKELDRLQVAVDQGGERVVDQGYQLAVSGDGRLPASVALQAGEHPDREILITVEGHLGGKRIVQRRARLSLVVHRVLLLRMELLRACQGKSCPDKDQTCGAGGRCQPVELDSGKLPDYSEAAAKLRCGDGELNPGEACDGAKMAGNSCKGAGFTGGAVTAVKDKFFIAWHDYRSYSKTKSDIYALRLTP